MWIHLSWPQTWVFPQYIPQNKIPWKLVIWTDTVLCAWFLLCGGLFCFINTGKFYLDPACMVPHSKVHEANMAPIWGRQDPGGPHVGPMNFALWGYTTIAILLLLLDLLHKSHNAPVPNPTIHHLMTEMCKCVHMSVSKHCIVGTVKNIWYEKL